MPGTTPNRPTTYQYKSNDQPQLVAQQFGISTPQLLSANQGGYPFSIGQTIKIPNVPAPNSFGVPGTPAVTHGLPVQPSFNNPHPYRGGVPSQRAQTADTARLNGVANLYIQNSLAQGIPPKMIPAGTSVINPVTGQPATPDDLAASGYTFNAKTNSWNYNQNTGLAQLAAPNGQSSNAPNADFMNTGFMKDYTANNVGFYDQKRWDPSAKGGKGAFVKIGDLIRQGKLDEKTGKAPKNKAYPNGKPRKTQEANNAPTVAAVVPPPPNANVNSVLSINLGSG